MSRTKNKGKGIPVATLEEEKLQQELKEVAEQIQEVLEDSGFGLQPFLHFGETGVLPQVRLVKMQKNEKNEG